MSFGEQVKYYRNKSGLSQTELAKKLKVGRSTIAMYETGDREPNLEMISKIAEALDVSVSVLVSKSGLIAGARPFEPGDDESETFEEFGNTAGPIKRENPEEKAKEDAELAALREDMRTRPEMRMLFKLAHGATEEDVRQAVKIIEALRKE